MEDNIKIIFSPTKERVEALEFGMEKREISIQHENYIFDDEYLLVKEKLDNISIEDMKKIYKLSDKKCEEHLQNLNNKYFEYAIFSYNGLAFRQVNRDGFSKEEIEYLENHVYIVSSLYGFLRPFDKIQYYRLDQKSDIGINLNKHWKETYEVYFSKKENTNDLIINLASKEYSTLIPKDVKAIQFKFLHKKNGVYKEISTESKKARGYMLNYLIKNKVKSIEKIKNFKHVYTFDNFKDNTFIFKTD